MQNETQPAAQPNMPPTTQNTQTQSESPNRFKKETLILIASAVFLLTVAGVVIWLATKSSPPPKKTPALGSAAPATQQSPSSNTQVQGLQLDTAKNYGNKYASGILPVGDSKYSATSAQVGSIYVCAGYANNIKNSQGGAGKRGPWFIGTTQYDLNKKLHVQGDVKWQSSFSNTVSGSTRTISTNNLPNHTTGVFPISPTDPSYTYDRNPNIIAAQSFTYSLSANPTYGLPQCMGGQVGVMLTGAALFNGFDAAGRDAGAWEVQDGCDGHPEKTGTYHYHTLSSCIKDVSVKTVIGYALDGFPITGPQVGANNVLTSSDLDACHGLTSQVVLDGKNVTMYHYVMTQDFPYSVSCFRATPIKPPSQPA
jgi:hypothetical protein